MVKFTLDISCVDLEKIIGVLPKQKVDKLSEEIFQWKEKRKRINKIKRYLLDLMPEKKIKLETLFRRLRTKGYSLSRKSFTRDIESLVVNEVISREVIHGGVAGRTTYLWVREKKGSGEDGRE